MNVLLTIWRASLRSSSNAFLQDKRMRTGKLIALLIQVGAGVWACARLFSIFVSWQSTGVLPNHLWLTCLAAWSSIAFFSLLALFQEGLNSNEAILLAVQPIASATRLRALYGLILLKGGGNWLIWEAGVFGIALAPVLGWWTCAWLTMLIVGAAFVVWLALIATLFVLRFVMPHLRAILGSFIGLSALLGLIALVLRGTAWSFSRITAQASARLVLELVLTGILRSLTAPSLTLIVPGMLLLLLLALLPLAHPSGQLYLSVLLNWQSGAETSSTFSLPGTHLLISWLSHSRSMVAALLSKSLLNQSRHLLAWVRLLVAFILLALFDPIHVALGSLHLKPTALVAGYSTLVVALMLLEYAPYAISSEGSRLALYLLMPRGISGFVRARLCSFLVPALLIGLSSALLLGLWMHLSLLDLSTALLLVLLSLSGYTTCVVLGSALDEDLSLTIEDGAQALIQEELPITPRRLQLLSLSVILLAMLLLLDWNLPIFGTLSILALLDIPIGWLMWRLSTTYLARLLR